MQIFICQSPATWGKMPTGFKFMWETKFDVYVTQNVASPLPTFSSTGDKLDSAPGAFKFQKGFKMFPSTCIQTNFRTCIHAYMYIHINTYIHTPSQ